MLLAFLCFAGMHLASLLWSLPVHGYGLLAQARAGNCEIQQTATTVCQGYVSLMLNGVEL